MPSLNCTTNDLPSKDPRLQLPSMPLHLVAMFVDTTEEVRPAMYVKHHSLPFIAHLLSRRIVLSHLYPFGFQHATLSPPQPPLSSSNLIDAVVAQLRLQQICRFCDYIIGDSDFVDFDPARVRDPLCGEVLEVFDSMQRCVVKKPADQVDAFVV